MPHPNVLATDLDGTLIPLNGESRNNADLKVLAEQLDHRHAQLVFVTGRHLASVKAAISEFDLPVPGVIICDVGSSVFQHSGDAGYVAVQEYQNTLRKILGKESMSDIRSAIDQQSMNGLRVQEDEKQGTFKLSYYSTGELIENHVEQIYEILKRTSSNCEVISSMDPFNGDGLIDLLPTGVSKAFAIDWWCEKNSIDHEDVVFSGDSGNDLAAMTAGYKTIVVGNADPNLVKTVRQAHALRAWTDRLYVANHQATSGVLEGCRHFGLVD